MILFKQQVIADKTYSFANQSNCVLFDAHNDSPYNMGMSFGRDTGADNADYYTSPHAVLTSVGPVGNAPSLNNARWNGTIYIYTETPLGTGSTDLSTAPAFQISVIGYPAGFQPAGTTSMSRMTATPNTVSTNSMTTTAGELKTLTDVPGTAIIAVQPTDAATQTWTADNSGNLTIKGDNAGTLTTLIQLIAGASPAVKLAAAAVLTEALGNMKVDGTLESVGGFTADAGITSNNNIFVNGNFSLGGGGLLYSTLASPSTGLSITGKASLDNGAITTDGLGHLTTTGILQAHDHMVANLVVPETGNDYAINVATGHKTAIQVNSTDIVNVNVSGIAVTGTSKVTTDNFQNITTGDTVNFLDANGDVMCAMVDNTGATPTVSGTGLFRASKVLFNIGGFKDINKGSVSASGTVNHGLSGTPTIVLLCPSVAGSTWTFQASTFTSTQFTVTLNSASNTNWFAYR